MSDFDDFLKVIAEAKTKDPKQQVLKRVKESIQEDLTSIFAQLEAPSKKEQVNELPRIPQQLEEEIQEQIVEDIETSEKEELNEVVEPKTPEENIDDVTKYLRALPKDSHSFQQPQVELVPKEFKAVQDKLKFLEQWVAKISAAGPGGGEVNLRWLDDIDRSSIANGRYLRYDQGSKKFLFDNPNAEEIGVLDYLQLNENGPGTQIFPGTLSWNPSEDCLNITQADGSTLQTGLEQYYRVYNSGTTTLTHGTLVGFGGIIEIESDQLPVAVPYLANATALPLYIMGILTTDIPPNSVGRATVFGKVRTLDTTGDSGLGETWQAGDLLWAHPTMPGRLTRVQPTSPYPAISVAAILKADATEGVLLVRPTIFPRLWFGRFRDYTNQLITKINMPYAVTFSQTAQASGFYVDESVTSRIVAEFSGLYKFDVRVQFTSTSSSIGKIWVWYRKNGVDVEGTSTEYTIASNGGIVVATLPYIVSMQQNDYFEVMWAADKTTISILSPAATAFCPSTPGAVIAVTQANL